MFRLALAPLLTVLCAAQTLPRGVAERDLILGEAPLALPGTLTLPAGKGPWPALVLVHGAGPRDRNETFGPNAPFRDLAWGLAQRGVAVYRYDKRTWVEPLAFMERFKDTLTVQEDIVLDAAEAARLLRGQPEVDPNGVFVLGHSLGGFCLPRIGAQVTFVAGFISLGGATRPLDEVILEQMRQQEVPEVVLAEMGTRVARVKALKPGQPAEGPLPFDTPASYWLDLQGYDPGVAAGKLGKPFLVLQGGRDHQVTGQDFEGWRRGLAGQAQARFRTFPTLNHLFMVGRGVAIATDFYSPGQVAAAVLDEIAAWVKSVVPAQPGVGKTGPGRQRHQGRQ